jgi:hypothetical protein
MGDQRSASYIIIYAAPAPVKCKKMMRHRRHRPKFSTLFKAVLRDGFSY